MSEDPLEGLIDSSVSEPKAVADFVERMGDLFDQVGLSKVAGRLFGVLLVCEPWEQSAGDLSKAVRASAASVNTQLRLLVGFGLVARRGRVGSRQYLYHMEPEAYSGLLAGRLALVARLRELAELGLTVVGDAPGSQDRLRAMRDFYAFFETEVEALIARYAEKQRSKAD